MVVSALPCLKCSRHFPWVFAKLTFCVMESEKRSDAPEPGQTGGSAPQREPLGFSHHDRSLGQNDVQAQVISLSLTLKCQRTFPDLGRMCARGQTSESR